MPDANVLRNLPAALESLCARDGRPRREIAAAARISPAMLSAYTSGRKEPTISSLGKLLAGLGVGLKELETALLPPNAQPPDATRPDDLELLKADLLKAVDERMAELGYRPGEGKPPKESKAKKGRPAHAKSRP